MKGRIADKVRLQHIQDAIEEIESYTADISFEQFSSTSLIFNASLKQLEIIGEASNQISNEIRQSYSNTEWRKIIGLRNILIHEYFGVDDKIIWEIIKFDIPKFKIEVQNILNSILE